ncbi:hypothetical protein T484DRAFT_2625306 [Baffinella frigidus]|nr:hypothetical protein T484DRAFT_2625306 [Cryptophyta sp. CCMP2293]
MPHELTHQQDLQYGATPPVFDTGFIHLAKAKGFKLAEFATLDPQPSTLNPQPSTLNPQPSTLDPEPGESEGVQAGRVCDKCREWGGEFD